MIFIGIDPGKSGGICVLRDDGTKDVFQMPPGNNYPEPLLLVDELKRITYGHKFAAAVERTQTRPGQNISAAHHYGIGAGCILGCLHCLGASELHIVNPQVWQKFCWSHYGSHGNDSKQKTYQSMVSAHPDLAPKFTTIRGKLLDGNSDSAGIATWLWHNAYAKKRVP